MSSAARVKLMNMLTRPNRSKLKGYQKEAPKRWNIVSGDTVQVIDRKHPEYGKQGMVQVVIREKMRVIVENLNLGTRQIKADPQKGIKGEIVIKERSMHYSNVNLVDPVTGFPTKVTYSYLEDGTKVRISKRSGAIIPKPDLWKKKRLNLISSEDSDTMKDDDVWGVTYEERPSKWEDMLRALEDDERRKVDIAES